MKRASKAILISLSLLFVASSGRAMTQMKDFMVSQPKSITLALNNVTQPTVRPVLATDEQQVAEPGMFVKMMTETVDNVNRTAFRHWAAVTIYDFKQDQWMAGAMTNVALVERYALHFDVGYAHPIERAAAARGSVLLGGSVHLDETQWFPAVARTVVSFVPMVPDRLIGFLEYTTVGGVVGYNFDRSIENNGRYDFSQGILYGVYVGLEKKFDLPK